MRREARLRVCHAWNVLELTLGHQNTCIAMHATYVEYVCFFVRIRHAGSHLTMDACSSTGLHNFPLPLKHHVVNCSYRQPYGNQHEDCRAEQRIKLCDAEHKIIRPSEDSTRKNGYSDENTHDMQHL